MVLRARPYHLVVDEIVVISPFGWIREAERVQEDSILMRWATLVAYPFMKHNCLTGWILLVYPESVFFQTTFSFL